MNSSNGRFDDAALTRLIGFAERGGRSEARAVVRFLAAIYNSHLVHFDFYELRALPRSLFDDVVTCLDEFWRTPLELVNSFEFHDERLRALFVEWGLLR